MDTLLERIRSLSASMSPLPTEEAPRLKPLQDVRCVAFDFYGTLFISGVGDIGVDEEKQSEGLKWFDEALVDTGFETDATASEKGIQLFEQKIGEYVERSRSEGIDYPEPDIVTIWLEVLQDLEQAEAINGTINLRTARLFAVEYEFRFNPVWPMPDIDSLLRQLRSDGYPTGIISNSQFYTPLAFKALTNSSLEESGFDPDLLIWSYRAGVKKPSPSFYRLFIAALDQKHNLDPDQVLFVGNDMLKDIMPASKIGMKTALFAGDKRSLRLREDDPRCKEVKPDLIITELGQLMESL